MLQLLCHQLNTGVQHGKGEQFQNELLDQIHDFDLEELKAAYDKVNTTAYDADWAAAVDAAKAAV